jgi:hypothetical protein
VARYRRLADEALTACGATGHFPTWLVPKIDRATSILMSVNGTGAEFGSALGPVKFDEALKEA